jgi:small subunit ribosomal protein S4e
MARGPKKHLKRISAPKSWMLDKLGGTWAPRPSQGPHKLRESIPLAVIIQHRLKYALTGREVKAVLKDKEGNIFVDGKVRRDDKFPAGFMDVLSIKKTGENFRVLYDTQGKFVLRSIKSDEAKFKLCKVKRKEMGPNRIPYVVTHDGRTIRFPHPDIAVHDTLKIDIETGKVLDILKFETGNLVITTQGNNIGMQSEFDAKEQEKLLQCRLLDLLDRVQIQEHEYQLLGTWKEEEQRRILLHHSQDFMMVLCCWRVGERSSIHDHSGSALWLKVLSGSVMDLGYSRTGAGMKVSRVHTLKHDCIMHINEDSIHSMHNASTSNVACTLHIYSPPYTRCHCYNMTGESSIVSVSMDPCESPVESKK